jgi:signal transduction histidine kinase
MDARRPRVAAWSSTLQCGRLACKLTAYRRKSLLLLLAVVALVAMSPAAKAGEEASFARIDELAERDPALALRESTAALARARQAHDLNAEMLALRDCVMSLPNQSDRGQEAMIQQGLALARQLGDDEARASFLYLEVRLSAADWDHRAAMLTESIAIAQAHNFDLLLADDYYWMGTIETERAHSSESIDWVSQAYALFEKLHDPAAMADSLMLLAADYRSPFDASPADLESARGMLQRAVAIDRALPRRRSTLARELGHLGWTEHLLEHAEAADADFHESLALFAAPESADTSNDFYYAEIRYFAGRVFVDEHRPREALPVLLAAVASGDMVYTPATRSLVMMAIARAQAQLGQQGRAAQTLSGVRAGLQKVHYPRLDVEYHAAAAEIDAAGGDYRGARDELQQEIAARRLATVAAQTNRLQELKVKFDVALKDRDNTLLKAHAAVNESRRLQLSIALVLSLLVLGGGALLLGVRLRATRSANALLDQLARRGREITSGLDTGAVLASLTTQLTDMAGAGTVTMWLAGEDVLQRVDASAGGETDRIDRDATPDARLRRCALEHRGETGAPPDLAAPAAPRRWPARLAAVFRRTPRSLQVCEPLVEGERLIGVVDIRFSDARRFDDRRRQIVRTSCLYAAVALANIRTARLLGESQVELEQQRTRDVLAHTARLVTVGSMASGIVHEMSHPVGSMLLQSSNVQDSLDVGRAQDASEALAGIRREARRLQHLIERLRNLCRADPPQVAPIDIKTVLDEARALVQPRLHMAQVDYRQEAPDGICVWVDIERTVLAIANIVFNAIDAMEDRATQRIEIRADRAGDMARITIRDTGPGFTEQQRAHLFEPFYTTKPPGRGLGLGLAMSVKSVGSFGGRIEAANHLDGGAVFTLLLRMAEDDADVAVASTGRVNRATGVPEVLGAPDST